MSELNLLDLWLPPDQAGEPVACLATSFTFQTDFFRDECLARFIGLRGAVGEEGAGLIAQISELEERLSQVSACVLVDRSASVDGRNLRWDVIPVSVAGGLLHAKTAILIWENAVRVIIGSANLTVAGYRYQREFAVALDLNDKTIVPRSFWDDYGQAILSILTLAPDDIGNMGPKTRAASVVNRLLERIEQTDPPRRTTGDRIGLVFSRPGSSAIDQIDSFMGGLRPRLLRAMSPFWDSEDQGNSDAVRALTGLLALRGEARAELLVPLEATASGSLVHAPQNLHDRLARPQIDIELLGISDGSDTADTDRRRLHAKAVTFESEESLVVMVGSSNMTSAGLGLKSHAGHVELNVIYSTAVDSRTSKTLKKLLPHGLTLSQHADYVDSEDPDEELLTTPLPLCFIAAFLSREGDQWFISVRMKLSELPIKWKVSLTGTGTPAIDDSHPNLESVTKFALTDSDQLPQTLVVSWTDASELHHTADWVLNVENPADLPLDERLRGIDIDYVVRALAQRNTSTATALERILDSLSRDSDYGDLDLVASLDPLRAYDDSRALLKRIGIYGRALDELEVNLSRPVTSPSALGWRLYGLVSPTRLAEGWADQCKQGKLPDEIAHFLLAELMLTINRIDWELVTQSLDQQYVASEITTLKKRWTDAYEQIPALPTNHQLNEYVQQSRNFNHGS
jgi:hypothetical protein